MQLSGWVDRLESAHALDPAVERVLAATSRVLASRRLRDVLHGTWFGHPLHATLTDVPIGSFTSAAVLDLLPGTDRAARALVGVGLASVPVTALAGWADWGRLERPEQRTGLVHAAANVVGASFYAASYARRRRGEGRLLGALGLGVLSLGALLGGHLAYRRGAGVNHTADVGATMPSGWTAVCRLEELAEGTPTVRQLGQVPVLLYRQGDAVLALVDRCSHLSGPLHEGSVRLHNGEWCVECPWHGSTFRLADGAVVHGPATAPQPPLATRRIGDTVEVRLRSSLP